LFDTDYLSTISSIDNKNPSKEGQWEFWKISRAKYLVGDKFNTEAVAFGAAFVYFYKEHKQDFKSLIDPDFIKDNSRRHQTIVDILFDSITRDEVPLKLNGELKEELENPISVVFGISDKALKSINGFEPYFERGDLKELALQNLVLRKQVDSIIIKSEDLVRLVKLLNRFSDVSVDIYCNDELFNKD
jgi:hypothetical protein